jgi:ABC-type bacteriocin/lantibiotic exporter with double-glycine peptidase domain
MFKEILHYLKYLKINKNLKIKISTVLLSSMIIPILEIIILSVFILNINLIINENPDTGIFQKFFEIFNLKTTDKNFYNQITVGSIFLVIIIYIINLIYEYSLLRVGAQIFAEAKKKTLTLFMSQGMETYLKNDQSKQIQIIANELNSTYASFIGINNIIKTFSLFLFFSIFLLIQNFSISLKIISCIILLNVIIFFLTKKKFKSYGTHDFNASVLQNTKTSEIIKNIFAIKQFFLGKYMDKISKKSFDNFSYIRFKNIFLTKLIKLFIEFSIYTFSLLLMLFFLKNKDLLIENIEILSAAFFAVLRLAPLANSINTNISQIVKFSEWLKPINEYLDEIINSTKKNIFSELTQTEKIIGDIDIKNLEIRNNNKLLVNSFNKKFQKGDFILLKGDVGSGKSTLIKILCKYYLKYNGNVKFNNINLKEINNHFFRKNVKYISQDDLLFNETIEFNITLKEKLDENDKLLIKKIYSIVDLDNFIKKKFKNEEIFDNIGESGIKLSGGEKQKILIARCLFQLPNYLFLDESFSNINKFSSEKIIQNLKTYYPEMTIILISHQDFQINFEHRILKIKDKNLIEF